jgi:hypothetical protein
MFHTVYKTTNLVNGKYYFGYHKTKNPSDTYLGSGTYIFRAVRKYGRANFKKEVLFVYPDAESAFGKEKELIAAFLTYPLCMNLREGENGKMPEGFGETQRRLKLGKKRPAHVGLAVAEANRKRRGWRHAAEIRARIAATEKRTKASNPSRAWNKGIPHSEATKRRISEAMNRLNRKS